MGIFSIDHISLGKYVIIVNGGPLATYWKSTTWGKAALAENVIDLPGPTGESLDIVFARSLSTVDATVHVEGERSKVDGFCILLSDSDGLVPTQLLRTAPLAANTHCLLTGIRPGSYHAIAVENNSVTGAMDAFQLRATLAAKGAPVFVQEKEQVTAAVTLLTEEQLTTLVAVK